jgi:hypothetical protein
MRKKITSKEIKDQVKLVRKKLLPASPIQEAFSEMIMLMEMFVDYTDKKCLKDLNTDGK